MKKILAFLALASIGQFAQAVDYDTTNAITSGTIVSATGVTGAANTCTVLSAAEPPVTINLSRQVLAAMHCNVDTNAVGGATQHPGGRPAGCTGTSGGERCAYLATTAGGPVTPVANGTAAPSSGTSLTGCASTIAAITGGDAPTACSSSAP